MRKKMTSQAGFTLVELLIAVVLLAVGLLGLAQLQVTAIQANSHSEGLIAANALGQEILEELVARPMGDAIFETAVDEDDNAALPGFENVVVPGAGVYRVQYWNDPSYMGRPNLSQLTIRIVNNTETKYRADLTLTTLKNWN